MLNPRAIVTVINHDNKQQNSSMFESVAGAIAWAQLCAENAPTANFQVVVHQVGDVAWCNGPKSIN